MFLLRLVVCPFSFWVMRFSSKIDDSTCFRFSSPCDLIPRDDDETNYEMDQIHPL